MHVVILDLIRECLYNIPVNLITPPFEIVLASIVLVAYFFLNCCDSSKTKQYNG